MVCQVWLWFVIVTVWVHNEGNLVSVQLVLRQVWFEVHVQVKVSHISSLRSNYALTPILMSLKPAFCVKPRNAVLTKIQFQIFSINMLTPEMFPVSIFSFVMLPTH